MQPESSMTDTCTSVRCQNQTPHQRLPETRGSMRNQTSKREHLERKCEEASSSSFSSSSSWTTQGTRGAPRSCSAANSERSSTLTLLLLLLFSSSSSFFLLLERSRKEVGKGPGSSKTPGRLRALEVSCTLGASGVSGPALPGLLPRPS